MFWTLNYFWHLSYYISVIAFFSVIPNCTTMLIKSFLPNFSNKTNIKHFSIMEAPMHSKEFSKVWKIPVIHVISGLDTKESVRMKFLRFNPFRWRSRSGSDWPKLKYIYFCVWGCLCDNWKRSFLSLLIFDWRTFSRQVTARWWCHSANSQLPTNQNSRNRRCLIVRRTIWYIYIYINDLRSFFYKSSKIEF